MKKAKRNNGLVYSTNPDFKFEEEKDKASILMPAQQKLRIRLDAKRRAGKAVTLIEGFSGIEEDLQELGKKLKNFCGTGGSTKDGEMIIQGDQREKVMQWLQKNGYNNAKRI